MRSQRKDDHIHIANQSQDGPARSGFQDIHLIHQAIPQLDLEDVDLSQLLFGKRLRYPVVINAMTGGTPLAGQINRDLASVAGYHGLAMAVGSQAIALEDATLADTFRVVRSLNPHGLVIANVSAKTPVENALEAVGMIDADALQVHLNVPQELAMQEGERHFRSAIENILQIVDRCPVPVIAKEVGFGISRESLRLLYDAGIRAVDNSGQGGTNFIVIEDRRQGCFCGELDEWGMPTAVSLAEIISMGLPIQVIASGGIRTALDAAKALAIGADAVGMAGPLLKVALHQGTEALVDYMEKWLYRLKAAFLMTGSADLVSIRNKPVIILEKTAQWLQARGIDPHYWARRTR